MEDIRLDLEQSTVPVLINTDTVFDVVEEIDEPRYEEYGDKLSVTDITQEIDGVHVHFEEVDTYIQKFAIENLIDEGYLAICD